MTYRSLRQCIGFSLAPIAIGRREHDRFIAAYPRSGSTWLRTMLANLIVPNANSNPDVFNATIPSLSWRSYFRARRMASPRLFVTHSYFIPSIHPTVYLVRDGRDALVSYYHYLITRANRSQPFESFFEAYICGHYGQRWDENVMSWLGTGKNILGDRLLVVKFEELRVATRPSLERILAFLGFEKSGEAIAEGIQMASLDRVREIERKRRGRVVDQDSSFYRGGKICQWQSYMSHEQIERFWTISGEAMRLANYDK